MELDAFLCLWAERREKEGRQEVEILSLKAVTGAFSSLRADLAGRCQGSNLASSHSFTAGHGLWARSKLRERQQCAVLLGSLLATKAMTGAGSSLLRKHDDAPMSLSLVLLVTLTTNPYLTNKAQNHSGQMVTWVLRLRKDSWCVEHRSTLVRESNRLVSWWEEWRSLHYPHTFLILNSLTISWNFVFMDLKNHFQVT